MEVSPLASSCAHVRLLLAPPGLAGLEDDNSLSAARLLFLFSASFAPPPPPPPAVVAPPSLPAFSLSRSLSLSRLLLVRSGILMEELLPEMRHKRQTVGINHGQCALLSPPGSDVIMTTQLVNLPNASLKSKCRVSPAIITTSSDKAKA